MTTSDLITYVPANKELLTVPEAFARRDKSVLSWVWRQPINIGNRLKAGDEIADIHEVFGRFDIIIKIEVDNREELTSFLQNKILIQEGIKTTETLLVYDEEF